MLSYVSVKSAVHLLLYMKGDINHEYTSLKKNWSGNFNLWNYKTITFHSIIFPQLSVKQKGDKSICHEGSTGSHRNTSLPSYSLLLLCLEHNNWPLNTETAHEDYKYF